MGLFINIGGVIFLIIILGCMFGTIYAYLYNAHKIVKDKNKLIQIVFHIINMIATLIYTGMVWGILLTKAGWKSSS